MTFLADENVDRPIVDRLRKDGHVVFYVVEMQPGTPDKQVFDTANREKALLLTGDKGFGELVFLQKLVTEGVILIRLEGLTAMSKAEILSVAVCDHASELKHHFTVITPGAVRIRKQFP